MFVYVCINSSHLVFKRFFKYIKIFPVSQHKTFRLNIMQLLLNFNEILIKAYVQMPFLSDFHQKCWEKNLNVYLEK